MSTRLGSFTWASPLELQLRGAVLTFHARDCRRPFLLILRAERFDVWAPLSLVCGEQSLRVPVARVRGARLHLAAFAVPGVFALCDPGLLTSRHYLPPDLIPKPLIAHAVKLTALAV